MTDQSSLQKQVHRIVNRGIILGSVWIFGIGSVISLKSAVQASKILKQSYYPLEGKGKVKKCYVIGIAGLLIWVISILIIIVYRNK